MCTNYFEMPHVIEFEFIYTLINFVRLVFQLKDEQLSLYVSEFAAANYGSVFAQIREVNRESRSECEFLIKSLRILRNTGRNPIILDNMAW